MSDLASLKIQLQLEETTSDLWNIRQKIQRFETSLKSVELNFSQAYEKLLLLEKNQNIDINALD